MSETNEVPVAQVVTGGDGKEWKLAPATKEVKKAFERLTISKLRRAALEARSEMPPDAYSEGLIHLNEAAATGRYRWGEPAWQRVVATSDGLFELVRLLLEPHHPGITTEQAQEAVVSAEEQFGQAVAAIIRDSGRAAR